MPRLSPVKDVSLHSILQCSCSYCYNTFVSDREGVICHPRLRTCWFLTIWKSVKQVIKPPMDVSTGQKILHQAVLEYQHTTNGWMWKHLYHSHVSTTAGCSKAVMDGGSGLLRKIKVNVSRLDGSSDRETNGICDFPSLRRSSSASEKVHVPHATVFVNYQQQKKREKSRLDFNDINISMITISN